MSKKINLADFVERRRKVASIDVDLGAPHGIVHVPPLELWPDNAWDIAATGDTRAAVNLILGDEPGERFTAAGGNWRMLPALVRETQGVEPGELEASSTP
jgi:hypothetical protein